MRPRPRHCEEAEGRRGNLQPLLDNACGDYQLSWSCFNPIALATFSKVTFLGFFACSI